MKLRTWAGGIVLAGALVCVTTQVFSQDKPAKDKPAKQEPTAKEQPKAQMPPDVEEAMKKWAELATPGDAHKRLDPLAGSWDTTTRMFMGGPEGPATESKGTAEKRWMLGHRYLQEEAKSELMGQPFEGLGYVGYDNGKNMYTFAWMDSMGTQMSTGSGSADPAGQVIRFFGQSDEPTLKVYGRTVKYVLRIIDNDKHVFEIYDLHAGDNFKVIEVTYTRRK